MTLHNLGPSTGWKIESSMDCKPIYTMGNPEPYYIMPRLITTNITKITDNGTYTISCSYFDASTCSFLNLFNRSMELHNKEPSIEWVDYLFDSQYIALLNHPTHYIDKTYLQDISYTILKDSNDLYT